MPPRRTTDVDALFAELTVLGEAAPPQIAAVFASHDPDEDAVVVLLRRALPVNTLEFLSRTPPWSDRSRVLAGIVLNPKAPPRVSLPLTDGLPWRSLAEVAVSPRVPNAVKMRAEAALKEKLPAGLRLGDRIGLGRVATPPVLALLLADTDRRVVESALPNPRLRESDLLTQLRRPGTTAVLFEAVAASTRWLSSYAVRLALALEVRCPLGVALAQLSSLIDKDLERVSEASGVAPLVQAAALRVVSLRQEAARGGRGPQKP